MLDGAAGAGGGAVERSGGRVAQGGRPVRASLICSADDPRHGEVCSHVPDGAEEIGHALDRQQQRQHGDGHADRQADRGDGREEGHLRRQAHRGEADDRAHQHRNREADGAKRNPMKVRQVDGDRDVGGGAGGAEHRDCKRQDDAGGFLPHT